MTGDRTDNPSGPAGDDTMLDMVESSARTPIRANGSTARLEAMRSDRQFLRAAAIEPAPAGLLDAALDEALDDAESLVRLERAQTGEIPVSKIRLVRERILDRVRDRVRTVATIAAAATLILGGGLIFLAARSLESLRTPDPAPIEIVEEAVPGEIVAPPEGVPPSARVIAGQGERPRPYIPPLGMPGRLGSLVSVFEAPTAARERSLAIVATLPPSDREARAVALADAKMRLAGAHDWSMRTGGDVLASAADGAVGVLDTSIPERLRPIIAAADHPAFPVMGLAPREPIPADRMLVAVAEIEPRPQSIAAIVSRLEDAGFAVELRVADEPWPLDALRPDGAASADWWSSTPASWADRRAVPVILEAAPRY
ncbi:MAG: hypothetical protein AAFR38_12595 [Planctomycetota bacterium]